MDATNSATAAIQGISAAITIIFIAILAFAFYKGVRRGLVRQSIRTGTIIISILLCFAVLAGVVNTIDSMLLDKTVGEVCESVNESVGEEVLSVNDLMGEPAETAGEQKLYDWVNNLNVSSARHLILVLSALLIFPMIFTASFVLISFLLEIVYALLCRLFGLSKKDHSKKNRLLGGLVGLVQGFIVATVIFLPFGNAFNTLGQMAEVVEPLRNEDSDDIDVQSVTDFLIANDIFQDIYSGPIKLTSKLGGNFLAKQISTVKIEGEKYDSRQLPVKYAELFKGFYDLEEYEANLPDPSEQDKKKLYDLIDIVLDDKLYSIIAADGVRFYGEGAKLAYDIEKEDPEYSYKPEDEAYLALADIMSGVTHEGLKNDVEFAKELYEFLIGEGVLKALDSDDNDAAFDALLKTDATGKTVFRRTLDKLDNNYRTKPLVASLSKLSIALMLEHEKEGSVNYDNIDEIYDGVRDGIQSINTIDASLSDDEYRVEVKNVINTTFVDHELEINDDIVNHISDYVIENYKGKEITEDDINDIIFDYYDAVFEYEKNKSDETPEN